MLKFPYTFRWIKGESNVVADALSRAPAHCQQANAVPVARVGIWKRIVYLAEHDPKYARWRELARKPGNTLNEEEGVVVDGDGRVLVPEEEELRTLILSENHDTLLGGHFSSRKTQEMVERHWTWDGLARDVREYVRSCRLCQEQKHATTREPGALRPILAKRPWQLVTLDFVGGLPPARGSKFTQILVIVDKFSKYVSLEPCVSEITAAGTAEILLRRIVAHFGLPELVISDRGPQFSSIVWKELLTLVGSRIGLTTPHHPQADGQSERAIQTLSRLLRTYARTNPERWPEHIPALQFAMNNAPSSVTRYSPFQIIYGTSPILPLDLCSSRSEAEHPRLDENNAPERLMTSRWVRKWWKTRRRILSTVTARIEQAADLMKRRYDRNRPHPEIRVHDLVLLSTRSYNPCEGKRKLRPRYTGPYPVTRVINPNAYELSGLPPEVPSTQSIKFLQLFFPTPARFASRPEPGYARPTRLGDHYEWEVSEILGHRQGVGGWQYRVKWVNSPDQHWLRLAQLRNCQRLLREYQVKHGSRRVTGQKAIVQWNRILTGKLPIRTLRPLRSP